jgi:uncharacterized protein YdbL (DUF1318 family)
MTILIAVLRALGIPLCIFLIMLGYYEGVPVLRDIPFADCIPVVRELIVGRVPTERAKAAGAAREGYVVEARATAAEAKAAELQRQVNAGQIVISSYQEIARNAKASEQKVSGHAEQQIRNNETILRNTGRSWLLDQSDIDFVLER